ncbi:GNAT family N-acetyltransferase [Alkalihalobacillus sp. LMS39]|uniref:GNAT family N-acetyltransferase n=1 Tax=Alkalihalobacillus sp. LMS39 TaxID=2924032 RepID=UPI001FB23BD2|nr:GNAT family N-acetyltransferase [Alkalihalobacillus sp. LMS39]UOE92007.1 GNAT family N-acetyltransferase [Alkalihalobacillus sp. LMS39]
MDWSIKPFDKLSTLELYHIVTERINIFVVEQNCPYPELDGKDMDAYHLVAQTKEGTIVAYARIFQSDSYYEQASIGRVIVNEKYRGQGFGKQLMGKAIQFILDELKETEIKIQAQHYLEHFYQSFGFQPVSEVYIHDLIPHIDMVYTYHQNREERYE